MSSPSTHRTYEPTIPFKKVITVLPTEFPPYCDADEDLARLKMKSCRKNKSARGYDGTTVSSSNTTKRIQHSTVFTIFYSIYNTQLYLQYSTGTTIRYCICNTLLYLQNTLLLYLLQYCIYNTHLYMQYSTVVTTGWYPLLYFQYSTVFTKYSTAFTKYSTR